MCSRVKCVKLVKCVHMFNECNVCSVCTVLCAVVCRVCVWGSVFTVVTVFMWSNENMYCSKVCKNGLILHVKNILQSGVFVPIKQIAVRR